MFNCNYNPYWLVQHILIFLHYLRCEYIFTQFFYCYMCLIKKFSFHIFYSNISVFSNFSHCSTFSNFSLTIQLSQILSNDFQCVFSICSLNFFLFLNLSLQILHTKGCFFSKCLFRLLLRVNFFSQNVHLISLQLITWSSISSALVNV